MKFYWTDAFLFSEFFLLDQKICYLHCSEIHLLLSIHLMKWDTVHLFHLTCHTYTILCNCRLKLNCIMGIRDRSIHANWLKIEIGLLQDQMTIQLVCGILIMERRFLNINLIMIWQLYQQYESIKKQLGIYIYI